MPLGIIPSTLAAIFGRSARNKQNDDQRKAAINALTLQQKQREDARRGRIDFGASVLGQIPRTTAGGRVNTNVALNPEMVARLAAERTYDFAGAVPNENAGSGSAFLAGLIENLGNSADETAAYMSSPAAAASVPGTVAAPTSV